MERRPTTNATLPKLLNVRQTAPHSIYNEAKFTIEETLLNPSPPQPSTVGIGRQRAHHRLQFNRGDVPCEIDVRHSPA